MKRNLTVLIIATMFGAAVIALMLALEPGQPSDLPATGTTTAPTASDTDRLPAPPETVDNPNAAIRPLPHSLRDPNADMVACTEEAKICPDGTAVGRTGPDCTFAPCPSDPDLMEPDLQSI